VTKTCPLQVRHEVRSIRLLCRPVSRSLFRPVSPPLISCDMDFAVMFWIRSSATIVVAFHMVP